MGLELIVVEDECVEVGVGVPVEVALNEAEEVLEFEAVAEVVADGEGVVDGDSELGEEGEPEGEP